MDYEEQKLERVQEDHPERCQAITHNGQCTFKAYKNKKFCIRHGGNLPDNTEQAKQLRNYRFLIYQDKIAHFADNNQIKSLREEIGILRMVMEETINRCQNANDLLIYSSKITDLTIKIEKLVSSCHRLESSLGQTLDKTAILKIATKIVDAISEVVTDQNIIDLVVERIGGMMKEGI